MTTKLIRAPIFLNFVRRVSITKQKNQWKDEEGKSQAVKYGDIKYFPRYMRLCYTASVF